MSVSSRRWIEVGLEAIAVLLSLLYTFRYINLQRDCFFFGIAGAAVFVWLCLRRKIVAEAFLQLFYVGFGIYGYLNWDRVVSPPEWGFAEHGVGIAVCTALVLLVGRYLPRLTVTKEPYLDAFTTVYSLWATWVMVQFIHENWLYWMIIDFVAILLYAKRKLFIAAALYALYGVMAASAYFHWDWFVW